jgi:hypothetical protein
LLLSVKPCFGFSNPIELAMASIIVEPSLVEVARMRIIINEVSDLFTLTLLVFSLVFIIYLGLDIEEVISLVLLSLASAL